MTHIVAGYPTLQKSEILAETMIAAGADLLEIQIPFSDPVADGPTIMKANQVALDLGTIPEDAFLLVERLRKKTKIPLLIMTYFNIVFRYGVENFCQRASKAGAYGLIIPDMPLDEEDQEHFLKACRNAGIRAIQVISPTTPERRLKKIAEVAEGFVYCVARTGTTGASQSITIDLQSYLKKVRMFINLPLALGFGIASQEAVRQALAAADIAVIGSKFITECEDLNGISAFLSNARL